jgi:hypothetical protein
VYLFSVLFSNLYLYILCNPTKEPLGTALAVLRVSFLSSLRRLVIELIY